jgi:lysine 2,3-aminomutase
MKNETVTGTTLVTETVTDEEPPSLVGLTQKREKNLRKAGYDLLESSNKEFIQISKESADFYLKQYPGSGIDQWQDWKWQIRNSITTKHQLRSALGLKDEEADFFNNPLHSLPLRITPHYAGLIKRSKSNTQLRKCVIPSADEFLKTSGEMIDPLGEEHDSPLPNLIHRYPDRVLLLVTGFCSTYCRYCTRSRVVAHDQDYHFGKIHLDRAFEYIAANKEIRDVLISGGDPFTMEDSAIEYILSRLRKIKHVEFIRIGTKVPVVLPQRITQTFVNILKKYHPLWLSIHFTHPSEITPEVKEACERLADAGIPLGSQTVLLKDINDNPETMKALMHKLLKIRVRPYYLYQCDPICGSSHFRTTIEKGIDIIRNLRGFTTGYAVPTFVVDAPGGGGKIPLLPDYFAGKEGDCVLLRNYENKIFRYPDAL